MMPADYLTPTRFCDIIMKGGVTSGVVYPRAIAGLAERFMFRNIGGTSVGAVAAALTAAAEYDRRFHVSGRGFALLAEVPDFLAERHAGKTNLIRQFRADSREMRRQLDAALKLVGDSPFPAKLARFELQLALWYWWAWLVPALAMALLADPFRAGGRGGWRVAIAASLGAGAGACALPVVYAVRVIERLRANAFGWCHGHDPRNDALQKTEADEAVHADAPLCDWLADRIDAIAGLPFRQTPLTFGALRERGATVRFGAQDDDDTISVRMMTTCLTLQQPFSLPFDRAVTASRDEGADDDRTAPHSGQPPVFWWTEADFERYFPRYVVTHLVRVTAKHPRFRDYRNFPQPDDLPLVVAARMSLSFPILLCAVPLYAFPHAIAGDEPVRVWFSDGGLTSNLPIQFFDSPVPRWPTFALDLLGTGPSNANDANVFIESSRRADAIDPWERLDDGERGDLFAFVNAIFYTTRTWRDRVLARLPGYADRTVGIRLRADEGGLNLNMDQKRLRRLASYGETAAATLTAAFAPVDRDDAPFWKGHRWTRYAASMAALARWERELAKGLQPLGDAPWQEPYDAMIRAAVTPNVPGTPSASPPESSATSFSTAAEADRAADLTRAVADGAGSLHALFSEIPPHPSADLGAKPPY